MYGKSMVFVSLSLLMAIWSSVEADDTPLPKRELLLLQEVPVVITPAKVAQPILESPSTVTVLTREDIKRYGMTGLPNILRNVPGVDVMRVSPTDSNISMRGFNQLSAGRILSLVDNRPIYVDFYGITLWELLPVSLNEMERVEIVRGPGSALYGANAFDGVVNIITDSTMAVVDTRINAMVNQSGKLSGSVVHGGGIGKMKYKASAGWDRISGWTDADADAGENRRFNGRAQYALDDNSTLCLLGGMQDLKGDLVVSSGLEPAKQDVTVNHLKADYVRSGLKCQASWCRISGNVESKEFSSYWLESDTFGADLQHSFRPLSGNLITWGVNYQFNRMDSGILDALHSQNLWAGYIQDQFRLCKTLTLTTGLRYDKHPLTGNNLSPRGSIVYSPIMGHAFRASAGRAFRNPSFVDSYLSMRYKMTMPSLPMPFDVESYGNRELSPERITSLELGYQGIFGTRLQGGADVFFNRLNGLLEFVVAGTYDENALFPGSPGGIIPTATSAANNRDADARGGEIAAQLSITRWLSTYANYSYQRVTDASTGERIKSAPSHKMNAGLCAEPGRGLLISLFVNHMDGTVWDDVAVDPYTILNSVISFRTSGEGMEMTLAVTNLLNNRHQEHPQGDEIGRSMILSLMYRIY